MRRPPQSPSLGPIGHSLVLGLGWLKDCRWDTFFLPVSLTTQTSHIHTHGASRKCEWGGEGSLEGQQGHLVCSVTKSANRASSQTSIQTGPGFSTCNLALIPRDSGAHKFSIVLPWEAH